MKEGLAMGKGLFVTGTGTDIGKTYVTGLIVKRLREGNLSAGYYKAAISGAERRKDGSLKPGDAVFVNEFAKINEEEKNLVSYVYEEAVSPHLAAKLNKCEIDFDYVEESYQKALQKYDYLTMEGSGGIICPLRFDNKKHVILDDLILRLHLGVVIVADAGLGTINAGFLTYEHLTRRNIPVKGFILNRWQKNTEKNLRSIMQEDNLKMLEEMTGIPVIAKVFEGDKNLNISLEKLTALYA